MKSIKPKELVKLLKANGWIEIGQRGSHLQLKKKGVRDIISVPMHNKDMRDWFA